MNGTARLPDAGEGVFGAGTIEVIRGGALSTIVRTVGRRMVATPVGAADAKKGEG
jgi:hypothetical protein